MMQEKTPVKVVNIRLVENATLMSESALDAPEKVADFMQQQLRLYDRECMCILNVNTANRPISLDIASIGTIDRCIARPADLFKSSILANASSIFLIHNHPSGILEPSDEDVLLTTRMYTLCQMIGIKLLDHIIVGPKDNEYYSFLEHDMFDKMKSAYNRVAESLGLYGKETPLAE